MKLGLFIKFDYNSNRYVVSTVEPVYENCSLWKYTVELPEGYGFFVPETGKAILTYGDDAYEADMLIHMVGETVSLRRILEGYYDSDVFLKTISKEDLN